MAIINYKIMSQIATKFISKLYVPLASCNHSSIRQLNILSSKKNFIRYLSSEIQSKPEANINGSQQQQNPTKTGPSGILKLSESCIKRLKEICNDGSFLRVTVEGGGCSGFTYKFDLDKKLNDDDIIFGDNNSKVVIDSTSLEYCSGSTIDYHTELIRAGFRIVNNPKAEAGCSCGASFALRLD